MRYIGKVYRPPSEADATYYRQRSAVHGTNVPTVICTETNPNSAYVLWKKHWKISKKQQRYGSSVEKIFVTDGDALCMPMEYWLPILDFATKNFPRLRRVSCYAIPVTSMRKRLRN